MPSKLPDFWDQTFSWKLSTEQEARKAGAPRLHEHRFHEFGLVTSGEAFWQLAGGRQITVPAGHLMLTPPRTTHGEGVRPGVPTGFIWVGFSPNEQTRSPGFSLRPIALGREFPVCMELMRRIISERSHDLLGATRRCSLLIAELVIIAQRCAAPTRGRRRKEKTHPSPLNPYQTQIVRSAAAYFRENLSHPLSISQVAGYHFMSAPHFSGLFRAYFGIPPRSYLQKVRLERVLHRLGEGRMTLKEIAAETGFHDEAHLSKQFRKAYGRSPGSFR